MSRIVLKWTIDNAILERYMLPGPVIAVAWQKGLPTIWIDHYVEGSKSLRGFEVIPTGMEFPGIGEHVGSAVSDELVFHVYEVPR